MGDSYGGSAALAAAALLFLFFFFIFGVALYVIAAFFSMRIFEKAGVQGKWRAWVPGYNFLVFAKLGDVSPWVALGALVASVILGSIPYVGWIFAILPAVVGILAALRIGVKLQKGTPWIVLYLLVGVVWLGILAFDKSRWDLRVPPAPWAANGFLADRTVWTGIPVQFPSFPPPSFAPPGDVPPPAAPPPPSA